MGLSRCRHIPGIHSEASIRAARCHQKNVPPNVTAYFAVFRLEQGMLIELLANGEAHPYGNHIQFHPSHLRLTDLEWEALYIIQIHPMMFNIVDMAKGADENLGINHCSSVIHKDMGSIAQFISSKHMAASSNSSGGPSSR